FLHGGEFGVLDCRRGPRPLVAYLTAQVDGAAGDDTDGHPTGRDHAHHLARAGPRGRSSRAHRTAPGAGTSAAPGAHATTGGRFTTTGGRSHRVGASSGRLPRPGVHALRDLPAPIEQVRGRLTDSFGGGRDPQGRPVPG